MSQFVLLLNLFVLISFNIQANNNLSKKIHHENWSGIEVIWLEDNRFPTFDVVFHFADGTLSDASHAVGTTAVMMDLLSSGTRRYDQKAIADNLEYFGAAYESNVTHENSSFAFSGLIKDLSPIAMKICHLFQDAIFPKAEIKKYKLRAINGLNNLVNSPGKLASRAFRELSMSETVYKTHVGGSKRSLQKINQHMLKKKLKYFNQSVTKKIYLRGNENILALKPIIVNSCGWSGNPKQITRSIKNTKKNKMTKATKKGKKLIYLVSVPKANQAKIRMGRFLDIADINKISPERMSMAAHYLGGGLTSLLMKELRVKRGLTYGVGAHAGRQKQYGRAFIVTSTKNESLVELITVTKASLVAKEFDPILLAKAKSGLIGSYPFQFESLSSFLNQLIFLDHIGSDYDNIFQFTSILNGLNLQTITNDIHDIYAWDDLTIVIVGEKKLKTQLEKMANVIVKVIPYQKFL